jgi:epoxyqueuosine reductase
MATDYHRVIAGKLQELLDFIRAKTGIAVNGRICVDSSPLFEKEWAKHAGIGSIGKNGLLIVPLAGSFVFLGELLLDMAIEPDQPSVTETCGSCTACLDHCPTGALLEPGKLDVSKCLSYLTVELKRDFTAEEASSTGEWIFGCDICQEVCPRNQEPSVSGAAEFATRSELQELSIEAILALTKSGFRRLFLETPIYRSGLRRLKRNALAAQKNIRRASGDDPAER